MSRNQVLNQVQSVLSRVRSTLASALIAALVAPALAAQGAGDLFQEGIDAFRSGDSAAAVEHFKDALAQNPSQAEVFAVWSQAEQRVIMDMLLARGELGAMAERFMGLARVGRATVVTDPGGAREVVERYLSGDALDAERALLELQATYGEWAVPALLLPLADRADTDHRVLAMKALIHLGDLAVPALVQALHSEDETTRSNVAATLGTIGDVRAAAGLAWTAFHDASEVVRTVAANALAGIEPLLAAVGAAGDTPQEITVALAGQWVRGSAEVSRPYASGQVAWRWADGQLQGQALLGGLYGLHQAERALRTGLGHAADDTSMLAALAGVHASMTAEILAAAGLESMADSDLLPAALEQLPVLELELAGAGAARGAALDWLVGHGQMAAAQVLVGAMGPSAGERDALQRTLNHEHVGLATAAALALGEQGVDSVQVIDLLGAALRGVPDRLAFALGTAGLSQGASGWRLASAPDVAGGLLRAKAFPPKDVILVEDGLGGVTLDTLVFGLRNDPRTAEVPLIVIADAADAEGIASRYEGTVAKVVVDQATWDDVAGVAGEPTDAATAAMQVAARAAAVLAGFAPSRVGVVAEAAAEALRGAGDDGVKIAVLALAGRAVLPATVGPVEELLMAGGSTGLQLAALAAAERLWAVHGSAASDTTALREALTALRDGGDAALALAAARALGQLGTVAADDLG